MRMGKNKKLIYDLLFNMAQKQNGRVSISMETIANLTGINSFQLVSQSIKCLEQDGLIKVISGKWSKNHLQQKANTYIVYNMQETIYQKEENMVINPVDVVGGKAECIEYTQKANIPDRTKELLIEWLNTVVRPNDKLPNLTPYQYKEKVNKCIKFYSTPNGYDWTAINRAINNAIIGDWKNFVFEDSKKPEAANRVGGEYKATVQI